MLSRCRQSVFRVIAMAIIGVMAIAPSTSIRRAGGQTDRREMGGVAVILEGGDWLTSDGRCGGDHQKGHEDHNGDTCATKES
ncbi:MAG: hypothetical protein AVDCRST_MAG33-909 [uncultured Thermomicrobiales bacterium]|uniref:Uncharacterized protein n=1 Tax=uncultured Thermomicrobiales bacterium TaxID=1645740 RepID=A0A6J4UJN9_9BACT|nr:MAG: hypothetical protein AVDCRST_MAG33-909 [uncultured Thermomicrobiales bacterium]